jgi:para-nitrobenzyl esterase
MTSPLARGLFHRAIGQSGGSLAPPGRPGGGSLQSLEEAEQCGLAFAKALGATSLDELRSKSAAEIQLGVPDERLTRAWPSFDGYIIPEHVHDVFVAHGQANVPLLTGSNANEGSIRPAPETLEAFHRKAADEFGAPADDVVDVYMRDPSTTVADASRLLGGHKSFNWQNWTWARLHARTGKAPVYYYHFSHICPIAGDRPWFENSVDKLRAFHTAEIPYIYQSFKARSWAWRDSDRALSNMMSSYWTNFAAAGDPNGAGLAAWERFDLRNPRAMRFDNGAAMGPVPDRDKLDRFDAFYARQSKIYEWTLGAGKAAAE